MSVLNYAWTLHPGSLKPVLMIQFVLKSKFVTYQQRRGVFSLSLCALAVATSVPAPRRAHFATCITRLPGWQWKRAHALLLTRTAQPSRQRRNRSIYPARLYDPEKGWAQEPSLRVNPAHGVGCQTVVSRRDRVARRVWHPEEVLQTLNNWNKLQDCELKQIDLICPCSYCTKLGSYCFKLVQWLSVCVRVSL